MKKFNWLFLAVCAIYACLAFSIYYVENGAQGNENLEYKVEIHDVMRQLRQGTKAVSIDLSQYKYLNDIMILSKETMGDADKVARFFEGGNGVHTSIKPFFGEDGSERELQYYVRFDYKTVEADNTRLWLMEGILFLTFLFVFILLLYIKLHILKPFHAISDLPYELSKGHLKADLEENKNRFFGKFIWGLSMLGDTLSDSKQKELKLLKEKKLLLLSISHDIKIPLSAIKLHAKAFKENMYDTEEKRFEAAVRMERHAGEIESFVKDIVSASSEDILSIEVENAEFYLKELVEKVRAVYAPRMAVALVDLQIEPYENKLLKGDRERAFEVMENLLENALKYGDGKRIVIDFYEEDYCQIVRVFNTGLTIPATELPHLFDSFFRGSNVEGKQGNGLGLYISRQIMNKMDGEIFAERKEAGMSFGVVFRM